MPAGPDGSRANPRRQRLTVDAEPNLSVPPEFSVRTGGEKIGRMLVAERETVKRALANQLGIPYVSLRKFKFGPEVVALLDHKIARKHLAVPVSRSGDTLVVAMEDPIKRETRQLLGPLQG